MTAIGNKEIRIKTALPVLMVTLLSGFLFTAEAQHVRIASFNVEHGVGQFDTSTGEFVNQAQADKYAAVSAVVARIDADIVAFQELYPGQTHYDGWAKLAHELGYEYRALSERGDIWNHQMRQGYFSRFPILSEHSIHFHASPDTAEMTRAPFRVVIDVPDASRPLVIWNTHHRSGGGPGIRFMRHVESRRIIEDINRYRQEHPAHEHFIVLGDFNDDIASSQPDIRSGRPFRWGVRWFAPGNDLIDEYGFTTTNGSFSVANTISYGIFPTDRYRQAGGGMLHVEMTQTGRTNTYTRWESGTILDYILVSDALGHGAVGEIYNSRHDDGNAGLPKAGDPPNESASFASDHFAIFVDVNMDEWRVVLEMDYVTSTPPDS